MTVPTFLTWIRIALVPVFIVSFYLDFQGSEWLAASIFAVALITDWLDGWLARYLQQTTAFGAFLDPVADKLIISVSLVLLVGRFATLAVPAAIMISREVLVSALREWMAEVGKRTNVAVSMIGKTKTAMQALAIWLLLLSGRAAGGWLVWLGYFTLYIALALTLWSLLAYLKAAWPTLRASQQ